MVKNIFLTLNNYIHIAFNSLMKDIHTTYPVCIVDIYAFQSLREIISSPKAINRE